MAPDGVEDPSNKYLYYLCGDKPSTPETVMNAVIAKQLGYSYCDVTYPDMDTKVETQTK